MIFRGLLSPDCRTRSLIHEVRCDPEIVQRNRRIRAVFKNLTCVVEGNCAMKATLLNKIQPRLHHLLTRLCMGWQAQNYHACRQYPEERRRSKLHGHVREKEPVLRRADAHTCVSCVGQPPSFQAFHSPGFPRLALRSRGPSTGTGRNCIDQVNVRNTLDVTYSFGLKATSLTQKYFVVRPRYV